MTQTESPEERPLRPESSSGKSLNLSRSQSLLERAERLLPGAKSGAKGILGRFATDYPQFASAGEGAEVIDVDGNRYIDLMGAFGPNLLGHGHPAIESSVQQQQSSGDNLGLRSPVVLELAEMLCGRLAPVDWIFTAKNGSDATSYALRVARMATGRSRVLIADEAYHTSHAWGTLFPSGVPNAHRSQVERFTFNDPASLQACVDEFGPEVAAIVISPFQHTATTPPVVATEAFTNAVQFEAARCGALIVLDDVRACMRMDALGASYEVIGLEPDLICLGKPIANGWPISICGGRSDLWGVADEIIYPGTHFRGAAAEAACLATFRVFDEENVFFRLTAMGARLCAGLVEAGKAANVSVAIHGPATMGQLVVLDGNDKIDWSATVEWSLAMARHGVLVHMFQHWYLCAALTENHIDQVVVAAERALKDVALKSLVKTGKRS